MLQSHPISDLFCFPQPVLYVYLLPFQHLFFHAEFNSDSFYFEFRLSFVASHGFAFVDEIMYVNYSPVPL
jgi:hypothetical protein